MPTNRKLSRINPFHGASPIQFFAGESQEEALSRIDYLRSRGGGWCLVTGPRGIGKSMLLQELTRRLDRRGEHCSSIDFLTGTAMDWLALLADKWNVSIPRSASPADLCLSLEERLIGWGIMNQPVWILADFPEPAPPELLRIWRWLRTSARRHEVPLTVVVGCRDGEETSTFQPDADLSLALWPWGVDECARFVTESLRAANQDKAAFATDAISALHERTEGVPGLLAKLCEFTWLAAQTESITHLGADLIHAMADELFPGPSRVAAPYESSAGYGAW